MQRVQSAIHIDIGIAAGQPLLGACFRFASTFYIDLRWALGSLRQNGHFVGQHFCKSPSDCKALLVSMLAKGDLADREFGDQRRVSRQNPQISVLAGNLDFLRRRVTTFFSGVTISSWKVSAITSVFGPQLSASAIQPLSCR